MSAQEAGGEAAGAQRQRVGGDPAGAERRRGGPGRGAEEFGPRVAGRLYSLSQIQHLMRVEFSRAQRYRYGLVCMLLGVDRLGALRDAHGFDFKEEVLDAVQGVLKEETRCSDFLGRMADDRLMVIVPHTDAAGGRTMGERLIASVARLGLGERVGSDVTLSIGACSNGDEGALFFDSLVRAAELALEEAVAAGGGRYVEGRP